VVLTPPLPAPPVQHTCPPRGDQHVHAHPRCTTMHLHTARHQRSTKAQHSRVAQHGTASQPHTPCNTPHDRQARIPAQCPRNARTHNGARHTPNDTNTLVWKPYGGLCWGTPHQRTINSEMAGMTPCVVSIKYQVSSTRQVPSFQGAWHAWTVGRAYAVL
jgi:hypothetical protein